MIEERSRNGSGLSQTKPKKLIAFTGEVGDLTQDLVVPSKILF